MARKKTHKDVEFAVNDAKGNEKIFKNFEDACAWAVRISLAHGGEKLSVDVLIHSISGARWWGGDYAASEYKADPDASVSDRVVISAEGTGRVY